MKEVDETYPALKVVFAETIVDTTLQREVYDKIYQPGFVIAEQYFEYLMAEGDMQAGDAALMARLFATPLLGLVLLRMLGDKHVAENWEAYSAEMITLLIAAFGDKNA